MLIQLNYTLNSHAKEQHKKKIKGDEAYEVDNIKAPSSSTINL